jgi:RNA polymerase-binding transcription factor DksA
MAVKKVDKKKATPTKIVSKKSTGVAKKTITPKSNAAAKTQKAVTTTTKKAVTVSKSVKKKAVADGAVKAKKAVPGKSVAKSPAKQIKEPAKTTKAAASKTQKPVPTKTAATKKPVQKVAAKKTPAKKTIPTIKSVTLPPQRSSKKLSVNVASEPLSFRAERSILDKAPAVLLRYSDTELIEFKELINRRLYTAQQEMTYLQGLIVSKDGNEVGGTKTGNAYDGDDPNEVEHISQLIERQIKFINNLRNALVRIENKTYGICRATGKLIDKARLLSVPHATLSMEAKSAK